MGQQVLWHPRPIVLHAEFEGQRYARLAARKREAHTWAKRGGELNFAVGGILPDRLRGVLHEIEEHLDELVAIGEHGRQRRIIFLDKFDVARDTGMRQPFHVLEHDVNVDGFALDRALVGEHFHTIDEFDDAVGLVADQPCQGAILVADRLFQQLRRPADAGQWILDFVRQHGRERGHRARGATMGELAVHLVGDRAFLQHDDHVVRSLRQRRHVQVDEAFSGITWCAEIDLVLVDRRSARADLVDERQQGASERDEVAQAMTAQ
jgi:hypothetical protein